MDYASQSVVREGLCGRFSGSWAFLWNMWGICGRISDSRGSMWAESVVHDGLCSRVSGSWGFVWPSQWFARIHVAEAVVHGRLFDRVGGFRGSRWSSQWFVRIYGVEYLVVRDDLCGRESGSCSWGSMVPSIQWFVRVYVGESGDHEGLLVCGRFNGSWGSMCPSQCISRLSIFSSKVNMPEIVNNSR